jgi:hypothetical protein
LLSLPITQSSVDYQLNRSIKDIRNNKSNELLDKFKDEIDGLKKRFLKEVDYIKYDFSTTKYILSRLFKNKHLDVPFENIYFQRRKDSFTLYQFFTFNDVEQEVYKIPRALKEIFISSICSFAIVPRHIVSDLNSKPLYKRMQYLIKSGFLSDISEVSDLDFSNLKDFFLKRNRRLKELINNTWKL